MNSYLIEVEKTETIRYAVIANNQHHAETLVLALVPDEESIDMQLLENVIVPVEKRACSYESKTIARVKDCDNMVEALTELIGNADNYNDEDSDDEYDNTSDEDYEPEEYFSD